MSQFHPFVLIVGVTGSGKSALGLKLAQKLNGAILNCDSLQVYQRLDIGTAKPSVTERQLVPHFLFDLLPAGQVLTAGDFRREALAVLERELPQRAVFGVGGSGFYIQALEKGMFDSGKADPEVESKVRQDLTDHGAQKLFAELVQLDPEYAETISPNDVYRLTRAMVVIRGTGKKLSQLRREFTGEKFPYPMLKLGIDIPREELLLAVTKRTQAMLQAGFLAEVRGLIEAGFASWPALQSVGYKECQMCLNGDLREDQLAARIVEKTMQLAKKQKTWFKRDAAIHWLKPESAAARAEELFARCLDSVK